MAEQLTQQQKAAVYDRGGRLLVSAAAGSGKTKVLVDRLISYLNDPVQPADLNQFLIITYTKAAAAELRGKIAAKLSEHMAADPQNRHLQRQMQLLYTAKISTVHAFCADILKEYAYMLDLPADFRVADESECAQLRDACVQRLLDEAYEQAQTDDDFRSFIDTQGLARDDRLVPEILLRVYDSSRCHTKPDLWLEKCIQNAQVEGVTDAAMTIWGGYLLADLHDYLDRQISAMGYITDLARKADGLDKVAANLADTVFQLKSLRSCNSWDQVVSIGSVSYDRMTFPKKGVDESLVCQIKAVRDACKAGVAKKLKSFTDNSDVVLGDLAASAGAVRGMINLVRRFAQEYDRIKRSKHILDFSDLEQRTLDLVLGKDRTGATKISDEIAERFREIMVDEYQDSNEVQDSIFMALTQQRKNCFMVGDVKQSIYQFRLADPEIFLEKYRTYAPKEEAKSAEGRKVLLTKNFRSAGAVLSGVNDVFQCTMSPNVGGLHYGEDEALSEGCIKEPIPDPAVELMVVDVQENTYPEEAEVVANRITQLLDGKHLIRDGDDLRPIRVDDIAILLRSPGSSGGYYMSALAKHGIRCVGAGGEDLLQQPEILTLRSILQVISNPRQDIALIAALCSNVYCFTADDLAVIRTGKRKCSIYDALLASDMEKAKLFLDDLSKLRLIARLQPLTDLLEQLFALTRMDSIYGAMDGGELYRENLMAFYRMAAEYEAAGNRDLKQFLEHLDAIEGKGLVKSGAQVASGAVTLTSIHKSKGLEYPVVFVSGLSRVFNRESVHASVLCDQKLGLGLSAVDAQRRLRYPTVARRAIASKMVKDSVSEELRVLYVALTRAKQRLIMTYAAKNPEKDIADIVNRMDIGDRELLTAEVACPGEWVLQAALRRTEAGELFAIGGRPQQTTLGDPAWKISVVTVDDTENAVIREKQLKLDADDALIRKLKEELSFRYAHEAATKTPSKQTATQRKGRQKDDEVVQDAPEISFAKRRWRDPSLEHISGTQYGTAMHKVLQYLDYNQCGSVDSIVNQIEQLQSRKLISKQQMDMVDCNKLCSFFATDVGKKLSSCAKVLREFKISILDDAASVDSSLAGEKILLQGVVDCAILEDDGITVLDFKTDRVSGDELTARAAYYAPQVKVYADALARIWEKPVKKMLLYFFETGSFVDVS